MKRGATQISTKVDNTYGGKALTLQSGVGGVQQEIYRQVYGPLLLADPMQPSKAIDNIEFFQSLDLTQAYAPRSVPVLGSFLTAAVKNSRNQWLLSVASPILETDELNFQMNRKEWNQIEYTDLVEGGIADEPTFSSWGWTDKLKKKKQSVTISMDLALDTTFGAAVWNENLAVLASDALLSMMLEVAYAIVTIGYANLIENRVRQIPFDLSVLYYQETRYWMAFAKDQNIGFDIIRETARDVDGTLAIFPALSMQFMREVEGESRTMDATVLSTNPETQQLQARIAEGPDSFKSVKVGDRTIDFVEMTGFTVNSRDPTREDPLVTKLTLCHAFPPNPDVKADTEVTNCSPKKLAMEVFYQTKEIGEDRWIEFKECLKNMWYYDPRTRQVSQHVKQLMNRKNRKLGDDKAPWAFNTKLNRCAVTDVNEEDAEYGYDKPDVSTLKHQAKLNEMYSWRHDFFGLTWDPQDGEYRVPKRLGDFHRSALPHEWLAKASRTMVLAFEKETGYNMLQGLARLTNLLDNIDNERVTWDYVKALINTQMPHITKKDGSGVVDAGVEAFKGNMHGSLRLPVDESGALAGMRYPPFFNDGASLVTLSREANNPGSAWQDAGKEAKEVVQFLEELLKFIRRYIGKTDAASGENTSPWVQLNSDISTLVDTIYGRREPIFMAVPAAAEIQQEVLNVGATARNGNPLVTAVDLLVKANQPIDGATPIIRNDGIRALSCLKLAAYEKTKLTILPMLTAGDRETQRVFTLLFDFVLDLSQFDAFDAANPSPTADRAAAIVSATTAEFVDIINEKAKDSLKRAEKLIGDMKNRTKANDKVKVWETASNTYNQFFVDASATQIANLKAAEKLNVATNVTNTSTAEKTFKQRSDALASGRKAVFFDGVFVDAEGIKQPTRWLRAPATATAGLRSFIEETGIQWIVPADPQSQHTSPMLDADEMRAEIKRRDDCRLKRLSGAYNTLLKSTNLNSRLNKTRDSQFPLSEANLQGSYAEDRASLSMRDLLQSDYAPMEFGRPIDSRNFDRHDRVSFKKVSVTKGGVTTDDYELTREFFGPWAAHLRYANAMTNDAEQLFYLCLIQAENTLDVHLNGADLGIKYFNVIIFRPFIEVTARSVIVMKPGPDTMFTPLSRFDVLVSKDDRGIFHIGSSFYTGTVRANPEGIAMIPYCIPDRFIGGKNVTFMTTPEEWTIENPLKPSLVCLPIPVSESNYGSPIHMLNEETYLRPGIDLDNHYRKYSSWEFYQSIFSEKNTSMVEAMHAERQRYWQSVDISQVGHICCRTFIDERTLERVDKEGVGPGCERRENMPGAEKTQNGVATYFPQTIATYKQRVRAM